MTTGLRVALQELPTPEARSDLRERILLSRAIGFRVALPTDDAAVTPRSSWRRAAGIAAAAVFVFGLMWWSATDTRRERGAAIDPHEFAGLLRGTPLWPAPGAAQESRPALQQPNYALILAPSLDTSRLREGIWTYESRTTTDDVLTRPTGGIRIKLARARHEARVTWTANSARKGPRGWGEFSDTAYLDAGTLRPLRHILHANKQRTAIRQRFSLDSAWEAIDQSSPERRSFRSHVALPFPRNAAFVTNWYLYDLRILAPALTLTRSWRGSLYQVWWLSFPERFDAFVPVDLKVVGRDRLTVPAGTFECWRLEVETTRVRYPDRFRMWIARDQGWVIKTEHRGSDYVLEEVLDSYEPAPVIPPAP